LPSLSYIFSAHHIKLLARRKTHFITLNRALFLTTLQTQLPSLPFLCPSKLFYELADSSATEGDAKLKEYTCVEAKHHKNVGKIIEEWEKNGWRLHTYQVTGRDIWVNHYLLFEKGK